MGLPPAEESGLIATLMRTFSFLVVLCAGISAQTDRPLPARRDELVIDAAGRFSEAEHRALAELLSTRTRRAISEMVVLVVPSAADYGFPADDLERFGHAIYDAWALEAKLETEPYLFVLSTKDSRLAIIPPPNDVEEYKNRGIGPHVAESTATLLQSGAHFPALMLAIAMTHVEDERGVFFDQPHEESFIFEYLPLIVIGGFFSFFGLIILISWWAVRRRRRLIEQYGSLEAAAAAGENVGALPQKRSSAEAAHDLTADFRNHPNDQGGHPS